MGQGRGDKPPTGSLYPRESYVCFFIFLVELAAVIKFNKMVSWALNDSNCQAKVQTKSRPTPNS